MPLKKNKISVKVKGSSVQAKPFSILRPSWTDMQRHYPSESKKTLLLYSEIGGRIPQYKTQADLEASAYVNSCAIRMSRGLNLSGVKLPKAISAHGNLVGGDHKNYWIRVIDLKKWLINNLGRPDVEEEGGIGIVSKFKGRHGIVLFDVVGWGDASGHFTILDGTDLSYVGNAVHNDPTNNKYYYFNMNYQAKNSIGGLAINRDGSPHQIKTTTIRLWELK